MPLTLKEEVLQMVTALHLDQALALLKAEIESFNSSGELDVMEVPASDDKAELLELILEPDEKNTVTHEEYLKATARWRVN